MGHIGVYNRVLLGYIGVMEEKIDTTLMAVSSVGCGRSDQAF